MSAPNVCQAPSPGSSEVRNALNSSAAGSQPADDHKPHFVKIPSILLASLYLISFPLAAAETTPGTKPNLIVIDTDDHGYADLGCMGIMRDVKTPDIDALASGGVRMTSGYVTAPQCSPSRCGLISGQYQGKFGMDHKFLHS